MPAKNFFCEKCDRYFANQGAYNAHMVTHMSKKEKEVGDGGGKWGVVTEVVTERLKKGGGGRTEGGGSSQSRQVSFSKGWGLLIIVVIVFFGIFVLYEMREAGTLESKLELGKPVIKAIGSGGRSIINVWRNFYKEFVYGEFSLDYRSGGAEIQKKSGVNFGELEDFGGFLGEDFGINGQIKIGKFLDDTTKFLDAQLSCELEGLAVGKVEVQDAEVKVGVAHFKIYNPGEREIGLPFHCTFDGKTPGAKLGALFATQNEVTKPIKLSLLYPHKISSSLEVFVLNEKRCKEFRGMWDDAFDEVEPDEKGRGLYYDYNSDVLSKAKYISDVEVSLSFDKQPLCVGEYKLNFAFKNKNTKNEFRIKGFKLILPKGIKFIPEKCEKFTKKTDVGLLSGNEMVLDSQYFTSINRALNDEEKSKGESFGSCGVMVDKSIFGSSPLEIVKSGENIVAALDYDYVLIKEQSITLKREAKETIVASTEKESSEAGGG